MAQAQAHHHPNYVRIWAILVVLLIVSVCGPMLGVRVVTLITAFGIAIVKAYLVAKNFMHINIERKYVAYLELVMIGLVLVFFFGVSPDVLKHDGRNWSNVAAKSAVDKGLANPPVPLGEHGGGHESPGPHGGHESPGPHGGHEAPESHGE